MNTIFLSNREAGTIMGERVHRSAGLFMRENVMSPVVRLGVRDNGKLFYRLENTMLFELDDFGVAYLNKQGFKPRLSPSLQQGGAEQ